MLTHTGEGIGDSAEPYKGERQMLRVGECMLVKGSRSSITNKLLKKEIIKERIKLENDER